MWSESANCRSGEKSVKLEFSVGFDFSDIGCQKYWHYFFDRVRIKIFNCNTAVDCIVLSSIGTRNCLHRSDGRIVVELIITFLWLFCFSNSTISRKRINDTVLFSQLISFLIVVNFFCARVRADDRLTSPASPLPSDNYDKYTALAVRRLHMSGESVNAETKRQ